MFDSSKLPLLPLDITLRLLPRMYLISTNKHHRRLSSTRKITEKFGRENAKIESLQFGEDKWGAERWSRHQLQPVHLSKRPTWSLPIGIATRSRLPPIQIGTVTKQNFRRRREESKRILCRLEESSDDGGIKASHAIELTLKKEQCVYYVMYVW